MYSNSVEGEYVKTLVRDQKGDICRVPQYANFAYKKISEFGSIEHLGFRSEPFEGKWGWDLPETKHKISIYADPFDEMLEMIQGKLS